MSKDEAASARAQLIEKCGKAVVKAQERVSAAVSELETAAAALRSALAGEKTRGASQRDVIATWCVLWSAKYRDAYIVHPKDAPAIGRLIDAIGVRETVERMKRFLGDDSAFYVNGRHSLAIFSGVVNTLGASKYGDRGGVPPLGCNHLPPCGSDTEHTQRSMGELFGGNR